MSFSFLDYCQYLLSSQDNYTQTNLANHIKKCSHDTINRYLKAEKVTPRLLWENVKEQVEISGNAKIIFDDTVLDKRFSNEIELVRRQYSGNEHKVIKGIGVVNCVYVNPETEKFWIIDYRIYEPDGDGKSKINHVEDMIKGIVYHKNLPFSTVLMDSWYATKKLMCLIDDLGKKYYCPLKRNRLVDDTNGQEGYKRIENLNWTKTEGVKGKTIKVKGFPNDNKVKLFRVFVSTNKTEYIVTNDRSQDSTNDVKKKCSIRWKIEEFHREIKQLTGIEKCQCRKARLQRNHIGAAMLVWLKLKQLAYQTSSTIYSLKKGLLCDYLKNELSNPSIPMTLVSAPF